MSDRGVTLEFLARLIRGLQDEMRDFRDQMTVQTAILLRVESAQNSMAEQLRAMCFSISASTTGCERSKNAAQSNPAELHIPDRCARRRMTSPRSRR